LAEVELEFEEVRLVGVGMLIVGDQRTFYEFAWARRDQTSVVTVESTAAATNVRSMVLVAVQYNLVVAILVVVRLEVGARILKVEDTD
jgi:hypothetical protein